MNPGELAPNELQAGVEYLEPCSNFWGVNLQLEVAAHQEPARRPDGDPDDPEPARDTPFPSACPSATPIPVSGVVKRLGRDLPELLSFFAFSRHLWRKLRTSNVIECCFVEVRRRTRPMVCFVNVKSVDRIIYSIF